MKPAAMLHALSWAAGVLLVAGCEAPNVFHNEPAQRPHATLVSENPPGRRDFTGFGRSVSPFFINDHPTAFWRLRDHFRLPAGETVLDVSDATEPYGFERMRFVAVAEHRYVLRSARIGGRDAATLSERRPGTLSEAVIATALRDLDKHHAR